GPTRQTFAFKQQIPSPYAIMRRAFPYRGQNHGPGKDVRESLTTTPGIREQPRPEADLLSWASLPLRRAVGRGLTTPCAVQTCEMVNTVRLLGTQIDYDDCGD